MLRERAAAKVTFFLLPQLTDTIAASSQIRVISKGTPPANYSIRWSIDGVDMSSVEVLSVPNSLNLLIGANSLESGKNYTVRASLTTDDGSVTNAETQVRLKSLFVGSVTYTLALSYSSALGLCRKLL